MRRSARSLRNIWGGLAFFAVAAVVLGGCGGSHKPIKYYQITYPIAGATAPDAVDTVLMVRAFEASHLYLDDKIVYGMDSPEMGTYEYQRWVEPPVEILQDSLVRGLRASGRFKGVYGMRSDINGQFVLAGRLYDFKEVDGPAIVARLSYETRLRDRKTGLTVWNHVYNHDEPVSEKSITSFVQAMDKNVQRGVLEVQTGLEEYFRAHPVK
ncbi:MAG TPA: ABC-type transport auxiliary lipoprotein family protein [Dongiaceae bacterium]|nr:ABC-type transport auxiliary lipoprotein family protein [Dongiaceae bacterium]